MGELLHSLLRYRQSWWKVILDTLGTDCPVYVPDGPVFFSITALCLCPLLSSLRNKIIKDALSLFACIIELLFACALFACHWFSDTRWRDQSTGKLLWRSRRQ